MITYNSIQKIENLDFGDYLKLPQLSQSVIKSNKLGSEFVLTEKIRVGKIVDELLTSSELLPIDPNIYNDDLFEKGAKIASEIKKVLGDVFAICEKQVSYTAIAQLGRIKLPVKARLDLLLPNKMVIDLKVTTATDTTALINHMGYHNQLWHYCKCAELNKAMLIICKVKPTFEYSTIEIKHVVISDRNEFWESAIIENGSVNL